MRKFIFKLLTRIPTHYITSGLIMIVLLFVYGVVGSHFIMGYNIVDSIYYATITMTTVGYGDHVPHTGIQKIFATTLALGGVALLAYVFNIILASFQEKMSIYSKGARKMRTINQMDDYYILCGYGRVGKVVFDELKRRNQNVIVFDMDEDVCETIEESDSIVVIQRDATNDELISQLAGEKCRSVIISTGSDVTNLFIVLAIRETNPNAWIVTRASKLENVSRLKKAGADKVVSPEVNGGQVLYFESTRPHLLRITVRHEVDDLFNEFKIISDNGCTLENIDYHLPGIETPLSREIRTMNLEDGRKFMDYLNTHESSKQSLKNLYSTVHNIHSHLISSPDKATFNKMLKKLEANEEIIGLNLTDKEITKITKKEMEKN